MQKFMTDKERAAHRARIQAALDRISPEEDAALTKAALEDPDTVLITSSHQTPPGPPLCRSNEKTSLYSPQPGCAGVFSLDGPRLAEPYRRCAAQGGGPEKTRLTPPHLDSARHFLFKPRINPRRVLNSEQPPGTLKRFKRSRRSTPDSATRPRVSFCFELLPGRGWYLSFGEGLRRNKGKLDV